MKLKRLPNWFWIVSLCFTFLFYSCSNESFLFGLDKPNTERISYYTGEKLLTALSNNYGSKVFYETLTVEQRERILDSLNSIITSDDSNDITNDSKAIFVTRAASAAIDILIYTEPLVYAVIYNLLDPILIAITGKNVTPSSIFNAYTEPLQQEIELKKSTAKDVITDCFYNLYRITTYYDIAAIAALAGSYSGSDLQKYLVSGLISGVVSGTQKAISASSNDIESISEDVAQVFIDAEKNTSGLESILKYLFENLPSQIGSTGANIVQAYKQELIIKANILEKIADNAGYETIAKSAASVLRRWGN